MAKEHYLDRAERRRLDHMIEERLSGLKRYLDLTPDAAPNVVEARIEVLLVDVLHMVARHHNSGPDRTSEFLQTVLDHAKEIHRREESRIREE